jgi:pyrimidine deaminase RibD-like protein
MSDVEFMKLALAEAKKAIPISQAYSVGAILVDPNHQIISTGYSREIPGNTHAEQVCLIKAQAQESQNCTLYTTMEPCSTRLSGQKSCTDRILESKMISRIVLGVKEPQTFVEDCQGILLLRKQGIIVKVLDGFSTECLAMNQHVL